MQHFIFTDLLINIHILSAVTVLLCTINL